MSPLLSLGRAGTSLVEMLLVMTLGGLITAAAVSAIRPTNELARAAIRATESEDGARSTVHLIASDLRRVTVGGVQVATADSVVVAMPVAVGAFCASSGGTLTIYLGLGGTALNVAAVDGYALRNSNGSWSYQTYAGTSLFDGTQPGRDPCVAAGGGLAGADSDYYTFNVSVSISLGRGFLVWDRQTFRFGQSLLDPATRGFHHGPTGAGQAEVAFALHPESSFRYRLRGSTTWHTSVASSSLASIDVIRVMVGSADGSASDLVRDIPLMNTE